MNTTASSQIFCGARFAATVRRDWRMERSGWGVRLLAMLGVMTLLTVVLSWFVHLILADSGSTGIEVALAEKVALSFACYFFFSIFTTLGAALFHMGYGTPGKRLNELMNPASTLERYASRFLICIVGVSVAAALCWEIADWARIWIIGTFTDFHAAPHVSFFECFDVINDKMNAALFSAFGIISSQAVYCLGSTLWPKNSFLKTLGAMCVLQFVYGFAAGIATSWFIDTLATAEPGPRNFTLELSELVCAASIVIALFCYITAYFRMREDEIIQRM